MTTDQTRFIVGGVLLLHGLGHGGAIGALLWIRFFPNTPTGGWLAAKSWFLPGLQSNDATTLAVAFWTLALAGFVIAALTFWGVMLPAESWRILAMGSAAVSLVGMTLFLGTWPVFNTLASLSVNIVVLLTQLLGRWPARELFAQ